MNTADLTQLLELPNLQSDLRQVEAALESAVNVSSASTFLSTPGTRVIKGGGKRLRPVLTLAAADVDSGCDYAEAVVNGAIAVELVHAGSLVHDDIIDEASERRGVPTVSAMEGVSHAILVGDYLLARAGEAAAAVSKDVAMALATTIARLCDGQSRETVDVFNADRTMENMLLAVSGKTAALMSAACEIGALCAERTPEEVNALKVFGHEFGMSFQLLDDALDLLSTAELMGKPVGNDAREGVYTMPVLLSLRGDHGPELRQLLEARADLDGERLIDIVMTDGSIEETLRIAADYNRRAASALTALPSSPRVNGLARLPEEYTAWALASKVP